MRETQAVTVMIRCVFGNDTALGAAHHPVHRTCGFQLADLAGQKFFLRLCYPVLLFCFRYVRIRTRCRRTLTVNMDHAIARHPRLHLRPGFGSFVMAMLRDPLARQQVYLMAEIVIFKIINPAMEYPLKVLHQGVH